MKNILKRLGFSVLIAIVVMLGIGGVMLFIKFFLAGSVLIAMGIGFLCVTAIVFVVAWIMEILDTWDR